MFAADDPGSAGATLEQETASAAAPIPPEAPAADPAPSSRSDGAGQPTSDGQPRDEHGRFAPKAGDATPPTTAPDAGSQTASAGPSDPSTPLDNRSPHPGTAQPSVESVQAQPLTFRAGGQTRTYQGAEILPDGSIKIAPDAIARFRNDLGAAYTYHETWQQTLARTKQEAAQIAQEATTKATTYENVAERLFSALSQYMEPREYELLAKELALDLRGAGVQARPTHTEAAPEQQAQEVEQLRFSAQKTLVDEVLTHLTHNPTYAKLAPDETSRNDLLNFYLETLPAYFDEVNGQVMLNRTKVEMALQREARRLTEVEKVRSEEAKKLADLQAALEKNAAKEKTPNLPPVVSGRGTAAPGDTPTKFETRAEYYAWRSSYGLG